MNICSTNKKQFTFTAVTIVSCNHSATNFTSEVQVIYWGQLCLSGPAKSVLVLVECVCIIKLWGPIKLMELLYSLDQIGSTNMHKVLAKNMKRRYREALKTDKFRTKLFSICLFLFVFSIWLHFSQLSSFLSTDMSVRSETFHHMIKFDWPEHKAKEDQVTLSVECFSIIKLWYPLKLMGLGWPLGKMDRSVQGANLWPADLFFFLRKYTELFLLQYEVINLDPYKKHYKSLPWSQQLQFLALVQPSCWIIMHWDAICRTSGWLQ